MQEIFEHNIQQQLGDFAIEPSNQTWMEIEKALHPRHEKRGIFWWWVPLAGIIVVGLMIWNFHNKNSTYKESTPSTEQGIKNAPPLPEHKNIAEIKRDSITKIAVNTQNDSLEKCKEKNGYCEVTHKAVTVSNRIKKIKADDEIATAENSSNKNEKSLNKDDEKQNVAKDKVIIKEENSDTTENTAVASNSGITTKNEVTKNESSQKIDSPVSVTKQAATVIKNKHTKKSKWFIVGEAGLLNINSNIFSISKNSPQYASTPSNITSSGSSSTQSYIINTDKGFGFALGVHRQNKISEHWNFETGFLYRYFQNKQSVGNKKDSSLGFANYYFYPGYTNIKTNYAHTIEIPLLFNYIINPKQKTNLYLNGGIEAGYVFAKKWLITYENLNGYYYRSSLLNNFQLSALFGVGINFKNHIQANINFSQAVTPLYKINNNKIYTNQFSLQVLIPVNLKNKK